jgi:MOSC domain-containing protein YiiM
MWQGEVIGVFIAARAGEPMRGVESATAVAGRGLKDDRYSSNIGTFCKDDRSPPPSQQLTLIEMEAIEAIQREKGISIEPGAARRNIVTRGAPLNHLVGREFYVGDVHLRGLELCEPCGHLEKLTKPGVRDALRHRGGLRAEVIQGGAIDVGDPVSEHRLARSDACAS